MSDERPPISEEEGKILVSDFNRMEKLKKVALELITRALQNVNEQPDKYRTLDALDLMQIALDEMRRVRDAE